MRKTFIILAITAILLTSCGLQNGIENTEQTTTTSDITGDTNTELSENEPPSTPKTNSDITGDTNTELSENETPSTPKTNKELYSFLLEAWKNDRISDCYKYVSAELGSLVDQAAFSRIFSEMTDSFGKISNFSGESQTVDSGYDVFRCKVTLDHAEVELSISIKDLQIAGITQDTRFTSPFEKELGDGITERYFLLESGRYTLNAVYTFCDESSSSAVLFIPGSGPSDYNETIGLLTPFKDIALGLAMNGVNSLRFEKRTNRYPDSFTVKSGLDEEYFEDCKAAAAWLEKQERTNGVYLLGHSLGGQIAAAMVKEVGAKGIILFNCSARHLADIARDQYSVLDPSNKTAYEQYAQAAKASTADNAKGLYYYSVTDYYWASYNKINVIESLKNAGVPVLIINSLADNQSFPGDLELWEKELSDAEQFTVKVYDDISHYGYKIDTNNTASLYKPAEFPTELIEDYLSIIKQYN